MDGSMLELDEIFRSVVDQLASLEVGLFSDRLSIFNKPHISICCVADQCSWRAIYTDDR